MGWVLLSPLALLLLPLAANMGAPLEAKRPPARLEDPSTPLRLSTMAIATTAAASSRPPMMPPAMAPPGLGGEGGAELAGALLLPAALKGLARMLMLTDGSAVAAVQLLP